MVGRVPFRPVASSHFKSVSTSIAETSDAYLPSVMSVEALKLSVEKYYEPVKYVPEGLLAKLTKWLHDYLAPFWSGNNLTSYQEAVSLLDLSKSPGFPLYQDCEDKAVALSKYGDVIERDVELILQGDEVLEINSLALKDELRPKERVVLKKTRAFVSGAMKHLLASTRLFHQQNKKLQETIGKHSVTIGISVPGPEFVKTVVSLSDKSDCYFADVSGNDARFPLALARVIRNVRAMFLEPQHTKAVHNLYDQIYCGFAVALGIVYVMFHQKSGWKNTGTDNSLQVLLALRICNLAFCPHMLFDEFIRAIINGDDFAFKMSQHETAYGTLTVDKLQEFLKKKLNIVIELGNLEGIPSTQIVFLSHSLKLRFHPKFGDFLVAAGNKPKLLSSISWVRPSIEFTFEESVLMHWLGLRIMLWPWEIEFQLLEDEIDKFLLMTSRTDRINEILRARISDLHIALLHLRLEGSFFTDQDPDEVFKEVFRLIKGVHTGNSYSNLLQSKQTMTNGPTETVTITTFPGGKDGSSNPATKQQRSARRAEKRRAKKAKQKADNANIVNNSRSGGIRQSAPGGLGGYPTRAQLTRFAASMVWPAQNGIPAVRYSDPTQTTPTALGRPWTQTEAPWGSADEEQVLSFQIFRSILRAYTLDYPYNTKDYLYYVYGTDSAAFSSNPPKTNPTLVIPPQDSQDYHAAYAVADSNPVYLQPHGEKVFPGFPGRPSRGVRFFWMEPGTVITGSMQLSTIGTPVIDVYLVRWSFADSFEDQQLGSYTLNGTTPVPFTITLPSASSEPAGWYGLKFYNTTTAVQTVTVMWNFGGNGPVLGQNCLPFVNSRLEELEQYRVISIAGRYENTAAPNFRAGKVAVYQVPAQQDNVQFIRNYTKVATASGAWSEEATEGSYGWLRPVDKPKETTMLTECRIENGNVYDSFWDLELPTQYKAFSVKVPSQTDTGGNPKSGVWWLYANVEYITESPWPEKTIASRDYGAWDKALSSLADVPGACTNKSHLKLLKNYASKLINSFNTPEKLMKNVPKALRDIYDTGMDIAN